ADEKWQTLASEAEYDFATSEAARQYLLLQRQAALEDRYSSNVAGFQGIRDAAFASAQAGDWVDETTADNAQRFSQTSATVDLESVEKTAQVTAMATLVTDMGNLPWAQFEQGLAAADKNAWDDVKSSYLALQSNINSAYSSYTQTRANAYLASATRIA